MNLEGAIDVAECGPVAVVRRARIDRRVNFAPEEVLEFNPGANSWAIAFDGIVADNWPDGSVIQGVYAQVPATPTATATASATVTVDFSSLSLATATRLHASRVYTDELL